MLAFTYVQRGEIPVDPVKRAIVDAHQRGVILLLNEITINLSGRVVNPGTQRHPKRRTLREALRAITVQAPAGETASQIGFDAGRAGAAFVARFLERGTAPPKQDVVPFRYKRNRHHPGRHLAKNMLGQRGGKRALSFMVGGVRVFAGRVRRKRGIMPRPILGLALQIAAPVIIEDFTRSLDTALHE
jgi:hypothetical protein